MAGPRPWVWNLRDPHAQIIIFRPFRSMPAMCDVWIFGDAICSEDVGQPCMDPFCRGEHTTTVKSDSFILPRQWLVI